MLGVLPRMHVRANQFKPSTLLCNLPARRDCTSLAAPLKDLQVSRETQKGAHNMGGPFGPR